MVFSLGMMRNAFLLIAAHFRKLVEES